LTVFNETDPTFVDACRDEQERLDNNISHLRERIATYTAQFNTIKERLRPRFELSAALRAAGFSPDCSKWSDYVFLNVEQKDLTAVYRVTGRLKKECTDLVDSKKKVIEVTLTAAKWPCLRVKYRRKLKKTDPCQIVRERVKARTEVRLVCPVPSAQVSS
jgi:hypothetical protein